MRTSFHSRFAFGRFSLPGLVFLSLAGLCSMFGTARAQVVRHGINSYGTDFYLSRMPLIRFSQSWQQVENGPAGGYFLICSIHDNNKVVIDYFSDATTGSPATHEIAGKTFIINKGKSVEYPIDQNSLTPDHPGEILQWKSAHIYSDYPITVQFYMEGTSSGQLYQGIPTAALGKSYVIAAWNDCPKANAPNPDNPDSTSSEFMVIAPYDNTTVTITPNSTTIGGNIGYNTGAGSTNTPHPFTINMQRGQIYWVRSAPTDINNDLSGSTVVSDKPVAVLGGQERAFIDDPESQGSYGDEDIRDAMVEEMTPVESWGSDYPAIPDMPASNPDCNPNGDGDLYRLYSNDPVGINVNMWQYTSPAQAYGPQGVKVYQAPAADWENVTEPIDLRVDSKDAAGNTKKMYAVQYQYFQWVPAQEESYRSENEMDLTPIDHYQMSTIFMVPKNVHYNGYQFLGLITNKDSLSKITITLNGTSSGTLQSFIPWIKQYQIPLHPELVGLTYKLPAGTYMITGNTPFASYSYGRTETDMKTISGYAAPTGQAYGSHNQPNAPKADITPSCGDWHIHLFEPNLSGNDGIADVLLLDDPDGFYSHPPRVSVNARMNPSKPTNPPFVVGDESLDFDIQVGDPTKPADAFVYAVDRSGNDTVIELQYTPPQVALSNAIVNFPDSMVGTNQCSNFTLHIGSTGSAPTLTLQPPALYDLKTNLPDMSGKFTFTSNPTLPAALKAGDSVVFTVCFASTDTLVYKDSVVLSAGSCLDTALHVYGHEVTPIIWAQDHDFGNVPVGDTQCFDIYVKNLGDADLILTEDWVLHLNPDYTFKGSVPDTIRPGAKDDTLHFCFHPNSTGSSNSQMDWGTNLNALYAGDIKDTSILLGYGIEPGMNWDRRNQPFAVECQDSQIVRVNLLNTSSGSTGADITVNDVELAGPNASEFTILGYGTGYAPPWQLTKGSSVWVDLRFNPSLANGYANRNVQLVANGVEVNDVTRKYSDTINCVGVVRHAIVTVSPLSYNFGEQSPGTQLTQTFFITNTGDTAFVYTGLNLAGTDFTILSGPAIGSSLQPGATDSIVIQYTAKLGGGLSNATVAIGGDHPFCNTLACSVMGTSEVVTVAESGANYPITYICHNDTASISATNAGTVGVILDSVQIIDSNGVVPASSQFAFFATDTQTIVPMQNLVAGQTVTFPVRYTPSIDDTVVAEAVFYWLDTSKGQRRYFQEVKPINAIGYNTGNAVTLQNPTVASNNSYTAVTANVVSIPVQLKRPFDPIAQVYGVQFTLRYLRDAFQYQSVMPVSGINLVNNPQRTMDPADNKYELLTIQLGSNSPMVDSGVMATVNWQYVVAKDSISPFDVQDVMFLDHTGSQACWVANGELPTTFYGTNLCGDATLREYLKGGMPAFSIHDIIPNPFKQSTHVYFTVAQDGVPVTMQVYNALGEPVQTLMKDEPQVKGNHEVEIDAMQLPSGLYTVFISTPGFGISKQVVVTK